MIFIFREDVKHSCQAQDSELNFSYFRRTKSTLSNKNITIDLRTALTPIHKLRRFERSGTAAVNPDFPLARGSTSRLTLLLGNLKFAIKHFQKIAVTPATATNCIVRVMRQPLFKRKKQFSSAKWRASFLATILGIALAGCGNYGPDMKAALAGQLSKQWQVNSFRINEWEIVRQEPRQWHYRFTAKVFPADDLYKKLGILNDTVILVPALKKGEMKLLSGTADASFDQDNWHSHFAFDTAPAFFDDAPKTAYGENVFIMGNPNFDALLASAETALQKSEEKLSNDEALLSQKTGEWNASSNTFTESVQQTKNSLEAEQQQLRQEQLNIGSTVSQERQAANLALQAEMREKLEQHRKDLDARNAQVMQSYRAKTLAWQDQYRDMQKQHLSRDAFSEQNRQLREQEATMQKQYREQLDQARDAYSMHVKSTQAEFDARRARLQDDITNNVRANVEQAGAALQEKSQQQEGLLLSSRNQLVEQRNDLDQFSAQVQRRKAELAQQRELLKQLKTSN